MIPIIATLASQGLSLIANAVLAKGKDYIEQKAGVKLEPQMSEESLLKLKQFQLENEQELAKLQLEEDKLSNEIVGKVIDAGASESKNITDRWVADTTSGDTLTKRIRPLTLIYLLLAFTGFAVASALGKPVGAEYSTIVSTLLQTVFSAYFAGRSAEKVAEMYFNHKVEISK